MASRLIGELNREARLPHFVRALEEIVYELNGAIPRHCRRRDYPGLRERYRDLGVLSERASEGVDGAVLDSERNRRWASIWLWAELTDGDPRSAPMAPSWNAGERAAYEAFVARWIPIVGPSIHELADCGHGPGRLAKTGIG